MPPLAIIPARGGSKRIPRKNLRLFHGKPIVQYAVEAALGSKLFREVMVSTDDLEIANLAMSLGASVPVLRSEKASGDHATTAEAVQEVLEFYRTRNFEPEWFCCIYPTAPFVTAEKLQDGWTRLSTSLADGLVSVTPFSFPIWRSLKISERGLIEFNWPENALRRSQDLPQAWHDCGQFYMLKTGPFLTSGLMFGPNTLAYPVPPTECQDIDDENDWNLAELKFALLNKPF